LEVTLDDQQLTLFTVVPPKPETADERYQQGGGHDSVDRSFNVRIPVKAGSHAVAAAISEKTVAAAGIGTPALPGAL